MITRSAKETGQQKEKWGRGLLWRLSTLCQLYQETLKISNPPIIPPPLPPHSWLPPVSSGNFSFPPSPITAIFEKSGGEGLGQWDKQTISLQIF